MLFLNHDGRESAGEKDLIAEPIESRFSGLAGLAVTPGLEPAPSRLIGGVIRYFRLCILGVVGLVVVGIWAFMTLPRSEDPEFEVFNCHLVVAFPGADPVTVESLVARPIEGALEGIGGIHSFDSRSEAGIYFCRSRIAAEYDPAAVVEDVREAIDRIRPDLPDGAREPVVMSFSTADIPIIVASISGATDVGRLESWAQALEDRLSTIDGVANAEIEGLPERQILVDVDGDRLSQLRMPLTHLVQTLGLANAGVPVGTMDVGSRRYTLESPNELQSVDDVGATVIGSSGESLVLLRDVARIRDGRANADYFVRTNSQPAALITVVKESGSNTVAVAGRVREAIMHFREDLPDGLDLRIVSDRGEAVSELLGNLGRNAIGGGVIVVVMVGVFLGVRQGLVVSISIPLSVLIALLLMRTTGIDLNQVSIFGIVLALGMLVDSGLVVVENIGRHLERGLSTREAVMRGVDEVKTPVLASTLTTIAAFVPLLALSGNMGAFILGLPLTVIFALTGSLLVALTVIPLLSYALWRGRPPEIPTHAPDSRALGVYTEIVKGALRHRWLTLVVALAAFAGSLAMIPVLGFQLFPKAEKDFFLVHVRLPWEANIETTDRIAAQVEQVLAEESEIDNYTTNIGMGGPLVYYNVLREQKRSSYAEVLINLADGTPADDFVPRLQEKLRQIAGASIEPKILEQGPMGDAPIQIRVTGPDLDSLARIGVEIGDLIRDVPGLSDLRNTLGERAPRLALEVDTRKAGLLGVSTYSFAQTVWTALEGVEATRLRVGEEEIPVVVRLAPETLREVSSLDRLQISAQTGSTVGFTEVAAARETSGFARITHWNGKRSVVVECDAVGRLADEVLADIRVLVDSYQLPDGYSLEYGGEHEERQESFANLGVALVLALLLIYALLAIQFNSFVQPLVILFTVPLGVIGAILGLLLTGNPFGFMAFIGIVSLTGIIINDSIVLTDFANYLQRVEGKRLFEALLEAGRMRFRPVLLTSVTTIGGLTPLAIWGGSLWSPLACAVIFGLLGATVLILVVLPVIYSLLVRQAEGQRAYRFWTHLRDRFQD